MLLNEFFSGTFNNYLIYWHQKIRFIFSSELKKKIIKRGEIEINCDAVSLSYLRIFEQLNHAFLVWRKKLIRL